MIPTDLDRATVPEEIVIDRGCGGEEEEEEEDMSVVGDRDTDVELVPVHTLRSHDWTELGTDPIVHIPRTGSDYLDAYSEAIADFVAMADDQTWCKKQRKK